MNAIVGHWDKGAIWRTTSGEFSSNAYFCELDGGQEGILIDPGLDGKAIDADLMANNQHPVAIVCTHGHFDHAGSAEYFQRKYGVKIYMHKNDLKTYKSSNFLLMAFKIDQRIVLADEISCIENDSFLRVQNVQLYFRSTPGHTPGSCIIQLGNSWFTGDTLYSKRVGLSKLPGEDSVKLKLSILSLWNDLTSKVNIYPGHGESSSGEMVKTNNKELNKFLGIDIGSIDNQ
jgi:glyoxylase-like metal-dependent hydrolase (beta-lactamase superfamily II)